MCMCYPHLCHIPNRETACTFELVRTCSIVNINHAIVMSHRGRCSHFIVGKFERRKTPGENPPHRPTWWKLVFVRNSLTYQHILYYTSRKRESRDRSAIGALS